MATKQTGPISRAGKTKTSRNAEKDGIYSKTVVLPGEDLNRYKRQLRAYEKGLHAYDAFTRSVAKAINDCVWRAERFNLRAHVLESMFYQKVTPQEFASYLGLPSGLVTRAPQYLIDPNHSYAPNIVAHAARVIDQSDRFISRFPWSSSWSALKNEFPDLALIINKRLWDMEGQYLVWSDASDQINPHWNKNLNTLNAHLTEIRVEYFFITKHNSFKPRLSELMEQKYLDSLGRSGKERERIERLREAYMKEMAAARASMQTMLNMRKCWLQLEQPTKKSKQRNGMPKTDDQSGT